MPFWPVEWKFFLRCTVDNTSQPFPTIGILGGGQLGRMSALAAIRMGIHVRTLSPKPSGPVEGLGESLSGDWTDPDVMRNFVTGCDVITVESEWAPAEVAEEVAGDIPVYPRAETLRIIRHKGVQRKRLTEAGLPGTQYRLCASIEEAEDACAAVGFPAVFKRFQGSYDGYGNRMVHSTDDIPGAWQALADPDGLLVEKWVPFIRELAVMVSRRPSGEYVVYPVVHIEQRNHRCHSVVVPAPSSPDIQNQAQQLAVQAALNLDIVGMLGVELFETRDGAILVNELAPRPHNSGHFSIESCKTSQFENHVRSILDWPLGDPSLRVPAAAMVNILGQRTGLVSSQSLHTSFEVTDAAIHIYGKTETRPDRKMGHVTVTADHPEEALIRAEKAASRILL